MMLKNEREALMLDMVAGVKAIISRGRPGTAAEISFVGPKAERIEERSSG